MPPRPGVGSPADVFLPQREKRHGGCDRSTAPAERRAPAGPIPCTARNALLKASPEAQPKRTAMSCSGSAPASTDEAATVMRRRQTYSETGMPAGTENIRRKWYCEVRVIRALPGRMPPVDTAVRAP